MTRRNSRLVRPQTAALAALMLGACHKEPPLLPAYGEADQPFIERAYDIYSGQGKQPRDEMLAEIYPVVVALPTAICVGLYKRRAGWTGAPLNMCFDKKSGQLLLLYREDRKFEGPMPPLFDTTTSAAGNRRAARP